MAGQSEGVGQRCGEVPRSPHCRHGHGGMLSVSTCWCWHAIFSRRNCTDCALLGLRALQVPLQPSRPWSLLSLCGMAWSRPAAIRPSVVIVDGRELLDS